MGFMNKLMFWKKKDNDFDLGLGDFGKIKDDPFKQTIPNDPFSQSQGSPQNQGQFNQPFNQQYGQQPQSQPFGYGENEGFSQMGKGWEQDKKQNEFFSASPTPQYSRSDDRSAKELEVISVKLDSIRTTLEAINQRLNNMERLSYDQEFKRRQW